MLATLTAWAVICCMTVEPTLAANPIKMITNRIPKLNAQIERVDPCPEFPDTPIQFTDLVISQTAFNKFILNGKINVTKTLDRPIRLVLEMHRCTSKDNPDSCEYYFTFRKDGICDLLQDNDKSWQYFTNSTDLPSTCPFTPKVYTIDGSTLDLKDLQWIPFFQSHWKLINKAYREDKLFFCVISEFTLQMTRRH